MTGPAGRRTTLVDRPRGMVPRVLLVVALGAIVLAGLSAWGDVQALGARLRAYDGRFVLVALLATLVNYALRFLRWRYYLRRLGVRVPVGPDLRIFLSGFAVSITPGKVGEVFKSFLLQERFGVPVTRTAPVVVAERLTDLVALVALTALGALAFRSGWVLAAGGAAAVAALLVACAWRPLGEAILRLVERLPGLRRLAPRLRAAYGALWECARPVPLLVASAISLVAWSFEVVSLHLVLRGFDPPVDLPPLATTFAYAAPTVAGAAALLPGGLGVTEASMAALLQTLGGGAIDRPVATAATILVRLVTLWFAVALGAMALLAHRLDDRRRRRGGAAPIDAGALSRSASAPEAPPGPR